MCFQISSELQFRRQILNGKFFRVVYAIKIINNGKNLIQLLSGTEIVSKLSRHFNDGVRTVTIIRNFKAYENSIELLDAFD